MWMLILPLTNSQDKYLLKQNMKRHIDFYSLPGLRAPLRPSGCGRSRDAQGWGPAAPCTPPEAPAAGLLWSCTCHCRSKAFCSVLSTTGFSTAGSPEHEDNLEQRYSIRDDSSYNANILFINYLMYPVPSLGSPKRKPSSSQCS